MKRIAIVSLMFVLLLCSACGNNTLSSTAATKAQPGAAEQNNKQDVSAETVKWPTKPVTIYTGKAGGEVDFVARLLAERLTKRFGQQFNVVNMKGSVNIPMYTVAESAPDGYTIFHHKSDSMISYIEGEIKDNPMDLFDVIGCVGKLPGHILCVRSDLGVSTLAEFIDLCKSKPGKITYATALGSMTQMTTNILEKSTGVSFNKYDGGSVADRVVALLGGHCQATSLTYGAAKDYFKTGEFIPLAAFDDQRNKGYEISIPTFKELGYDFENFQIHYFQAFPKGTDPAIKNKLVAAIQDIVKNDKEYAQRLADSYQMDPIFMTGDEFAKYYNAQKPIMEQLLAAH